MAKGTTNVISVPRTRQKTVPEHETREQRFMRVAERRVSTTIKAIWRLGYLGGNNYKSSPDQIAEMRAAIMDAVEHAFTQLANTKPSRQAAFKFTKE